MMSSKKYKKSRQGAALLVVLFIVMVITILSLGFLSRSDVELACGRNMVLRTQMDYLVESGLEHARGLILNPQDVVSEYFTGATGQQLVAGSDDYYDLEVVRDDSVPMNRCNYIIDCNSYRLRNGEKIGRSSIRGELRLDPCIAYWAGSDTTVSSKMVINGDVYCDGMLTNNGNINGDVFANGLNGSGSIAGQQKAVGDLSLAWPRVTVQVFTSKYPVQIIDANSLSGGTFGPYDPVRVCHRIGDLELDGGVQIEGMLIVDANLTISGNGNVITAGKNLPALLVSGDLIIEDGCGLDVYGLAVVKGQTQISSGATGVNIIGGLFVENGIVGDGNIFITAAPAKTAIVVWSEGGIAGKWGQAAGAFFRNIERK
jgi:cytoskeletal protein CcmA (bactofilin family)